MSDVSQEAFDIMKMASEIWRLKYLQAKDEITKLEQHIVILTGELERERQYILGMERLGRGREIR
mgnify:CR=1 FL=1